ncbi:CMT1A duplicated region transcript 4 protein [Marmota marmota marmota]|uniref:CMT1A duplicated region transcript 4 protein n=1 Tax=Marmota marmota marmota TaxID=9994 RepID=UPI0007626931|nr:CMT1A duplicated region transcript 4 protein [Marmota marmota marmota]
MTLDGGPVDPLANLQSPSSGGCPAISHPEGGPCILCFNKSSSSTIVLITICLTPETGPTENIGLPKKLLDKNDPWPAYVTYISPVVKRLIEKSKTRELEYRQTFEESQRASRLNKPSSTLQMGGRIKSFKSSEEAVFKDMLSETMLSMLATYSFLDSPVAPEPTYLQKDSRECPTANYNKIIFPRKPMMRMLPYSSLPASKEK